MNKQRKLVMKPKNPKIFLVINMPEPSGNRAARRRKKKEER